MSDIETSGRCGEGVFLFLEIFWSGTDNWPCLHVSSADRVPYGAHTCSRWLRNITDRARHNITAFIRMTAALALADSGVPIGVAARHKAMVQLASPQVAATIEFVSNRRRRAYA